jgi:hypothetical protein
VIKQRASTGAHPPRIHTPRDPRVDPDAFVLEVVTTGGQTALVRFRILRDVVEIWHHDRRSGVFDREILRGWLSNQDPNRLALIVDEVALSIDRMVDATGRVAISLPDVMVWTIEPHALQRLRQRI